MHGSHSYIAVRARENKAAMNVTMCTAAMAALASVQPAVLPSPRTAMVQIDQNGTENKMTKQSQHQTYLDRPGRAQIDAYDLN
jgi:hypothetical protein